MGMEDRDFSYDMETIVMIRRKIVIQSTRKFCRMKGGIFTNILRMSVCIKYSTSFG